MSWRAVTIGSCPAPCIPIQRVAFFLGDIHLSWYSNVTRKVRCLSGRLLNFEDASEYASYIASSLSKTSKHHQAFDVIILFIIFINYLEEHKEN